ncbi:MAG: hypothetical protein EXS05_04695 [Planctomycetaceae bacterium]|nr:hypothetical protein [Planctomycetaceae bacterium]
MSKSECRMKSDLSVFWLNYRIPDSGITRHNPKMSKRHRRNLTYREAATWGTPFALIFLVVGAWLAMRVNWLLQDALLIFWPACGFIIGLLIAEWRISK